MSLTDRVKLHYDNLLLEANIEKKTFELLRLIELPHIENIDALPPEFEYHSLCCFETSAITKRLNNAASVAADALPQPLLAEPPECSGMQQQQEQTVTSFESVFGDCNNNQVLRLFNRFRSLHNYLNDEYPSLQQNYFPSDYVFNWPVKCSLPGTLSVQYHIQVAVRKLTKFTTRLRRVLSTNRFFDYAKYKECDDSLQMLEKMVNELIQYRSIEFRHKDFEFINEQMIVDVENLINLIERINDQIREVHLFITVFNWEMDLEHRQSKTMIAQRKETIDYAMKLIEQQKHLDNMKGQNSKSIGIQIPAKYELDDVAAAASQFDEMLTKLVTQPEIYVPHYFDNSISMNARTTTMSGTAAEIEPSADILALINANNQAANANRNIVTLYQTDDLILQEIPFDPLEPPRFNLQRAFNVTRYVG